MTYDIFDNSSIFRPQFINTWMVKHFDSQGPQSLSFESCTQSRLQSHWMWQFIICWIRMNWSPNAPEKATYGQKSTDHPLHLSLSHVQFWLLCLTSSNCKRMIIVTLQFTYGYRWLLPSKPWRLTDNDDALSKNLKKQVCCSMRNFIGLHNYSYSHFCNLLRA